MPYDLRSGTSFGSVFTGYRGSCSARGARGGYTSGYGAMSTNDPYVIPPHQTPLPNVGNSSVEEVGTQINDVVASIDAIKSALDNLTGTTEFERGIKTVCSLIVGQLREIKVAQTNLHKDHVKINDRINTHCDQAYNTFCDHELSIVKMEQYTRRDTITVLGLQKTDTETTESLTKRVASTLSNSSVEVKPTDLSVVHRNSKSDRIIRGKTIPPSITARFNSINLKDEVIRKYKNFDHTKSQPRECRIYNSLSPHYTELRKNIICAVFVMLCREETQILL